MSSKRDGGARGRIPRFATPSCDAARGHLARRMSATEQPNAVSAMGSVAGAAVEENWCGAFSRTSFCSTSSSVSSSPSAAFAVSCLRSFASACNRGWRCHGSGGSSADCTVGISGAWAQAHGIAFKLRGSCYRAVFKRRGCCYRAQRGIAAVHWRAQARADCTLGTSGTRAPADGIVLKQPDSSYRAEFKRRCSCYRAERGAPDD